MPETQSDTAARLFPLICDDLGFMDQQAQDRLLVCELPLAQWIFARQQRVGRTSLVGINGPQGCGKSTTVASLKALLETYYGLRVAIVSIDDFYLTLAERQALSQTVHPLLKTRGVPGTHDVDLAMRVLSRLRSGTSGTLAVPLFDKASDDRAPHHQWPVFTMPVDVILFEGWCVGATPESEQALAAPINELESSEDTKGAWRQYVNLSLASGYHELFALLDSLIVFSCGDFSWVYDWRRQQEQDNARRAKARGGSTTAIMNDAQLKRFVLHYERITTHCQRVLPTLADVVVPLSKSRQVTALRWRQNE
jgi:D-glycerate 3-kinase